MNSSIRNNITCNTKVGSRHFSSLWVVVLVEALWSREAYPYPEALFKIDICFHYDGRGTVWSTEDWMTPFSLWGSCHVGGSGLVSAIATLGTLQSRLPHHGWLSNRVSSGGYSSFTESWSGNHTSKYVTENILSNHFRFWWSVFGNQASGGKSSRSGRICSWRLLSNLTVF